MICVNGSMMLRKADWARHNHGTRNRGAFHIPYTCFQIHTPYSIARSQQYTTLPSSVCTIPCDGDPFPCLHKVQLSVTDHSRSMSRPFYQRYEGYMREPIQVHLLFCTSAPALRHFTFSRTTTRLNIEYAPVSFSAGKEDLKVYQGIG